MKLTVYEVKALLTMLAYEIEGIEKEIDYAEKDLKENYWDYYPLDKKMTEQLNAKKRYVVHLKNAQEKFSQMLKRELSEI